MDTSAADEPAPRDYIDQVQRLAAIELSGTPCPEPARLPPCAVQRDEEQRAHDALRRLLARAGPQHRAGRRDRGRLPLPRALPAAGAEEPDEARARGVRHRRQGLLGVLLQHADAAQHPRPQDGQDRTADELRGHGDAHVRGAARADRGRLHVRDVRRRGAHRRPLSPPLPPPTLQPARRPWDTAPQPPLVSGRRLSHRCGTNSDPVPQQFKYTQPVKCKNPVRTGQGGPGRGGAGGGRGEGGKGTRGASRCGGHAALQLQPRRRLAPSACPPLLAPL